MIQERRTIANLFILGSQKCGTTFLAELLSRQKGFFLPSIKETYFFCEDSAYRQGIDWYESEFYKPSLKGEFTYNIDATPFYYCNPEALRRIATYTDRTARYIVILRNPVERAYSAYWHQRRLGRENLSFEEALVAEPERIQAAERSGGRWWRYAYKECGMYGKHLTALGTILDPARILVLTSGMLRRDDFLPQISEFLGANIEAKKISNDNSASNPRFRKIQDMIIKDNRMKRIIQRVLPRESRTAIARAILRANLVPTRHPRLSEDFHSRLMLDFSTDRETLMDLDWLPNYIRGEISKIYSI
jgi:Sulfotransferase domain